MDLNTITEIARPRRRADVAAWQVSWRPGDAWLAGGTWLFSEPQPRLSRLIDLAGFGWQSIDIADTSLTIAATCTIGELDATALPRGWAAAPLFNQCCRAFFSSFKVWNIATVGGNLCMSLPAGPMISLTAALDGVCRIWTPAGGERRLAVSDFVVGPQRNALQPGELLRAVELPAAALMRRTAFRQISLTPLGRSAALLIGTRSPRERHFAVTVTAATVRPITLAFAALPSSDELRARIEAEIPDDAYHDDVHGAPAWRRHMTFRFAEEIRRELADAAPS